MLRSSSSLSLATMTYICRTAAAEVPRNRCRQDMCRPRRIILMIIFGMTRTRRRSRAMVALWRRLFHDRNALSANIFDACRIYGPVYKLRHRPLSSSIAAAPLHIYLSTTLMLALFAAAMPARRFIIFAASAAGARLPVVGDILLFLRMLFCRQMPHLSLGIRRRYSVLAPDAFSKNFCNAAVVVLQPPLSYSYRCNASVGGITGRSSIHRFTIGNDTKIMAWSVALNFDAMASRFLHRFAFFSLLKRPAAAISGRRRIFSICSHCRKIVG